MAWAVAAVEAAAELDQLLCLLGLAPLGVEAVGVELERLAAVHGVHHPAGRERVGPAQPKLGLELVGRDVELVRGQDGGLISVNRAHRRIAKAPVGIRQAHMSGEIERARS